MQKVAASLFNSKFTILVPIRRRPLVRAWRIIPELHEFGIAREFRAEIER